jgi:hypothetical protein
MGRRLVLGVTAPTIAVGLATLGRVHWFPNRHLGGSIFKAGGNAARLGTRARADRHHVSCHGCAPLPCRPAEDPPGLAGPGATGLRQS